MICLNWMAKNRADYSIIQHEPTSVEWGNITIEIVLAVEHIKAFWFEAFEVHVNVTPPSLLRISTRKRSARAP